MRRAIALLLVAVALAYAQLSQAALTVTKAPVEMFLCAIDFTRVIQTDGISLVSVTAVNANTGANSTSIVIASSPVPAVIPGTDKIAFMVQGGSVNDLHHISVIASDLTSGAQYVGKVDLKISMWP